MSATPVEVEKQPKCIYKINYYFIKQKPQNIVTKKHKIYSILCFLYKWIQIVHLKWWRCGDLHSGLERKLQNFLHTYRTIYLGLTLVVRDQRIIHNRWIPLWQHGKIAKAVPRLSDALSFPDGKRKAERTLKLSSVC